ncbi:hypothetical protein E4U43_007140 [Claviceps pusilla]|uniref:Uncharacterized protein n=1 Tax=Claviceps pusilla TaxID=123648 RepID=A0A9P7T1X0_9HYPO|nr:hypothetical protein E4U43_007140 [Claviceps pusilla]
MRDRSISPPPRTPTPRRFLLSSRRPPGSQPRQTPVPQASQFQSTPRFGSSSCSSVPRPGPGPGPGVRRRALSIEEVEEEEEEELEEKEDASSCGTTVTDGDGNAVEDMNRAGRKERDLEVDSISSASPPRGDISPREETSVQGHQDHGATSASCSGGDSEGESARRAKRRRVVLSVSSPVGSCMSLDDDEEEEEEEEARETLAVEGVYGSSCDDEDEDEDDREDQEEEEEEKNDDDDIGKYKPAQQQPVFRPPPRFKLPEVFDDEAMHMHMHMQGGILPRASSPPRRQRRGRAYPAGGLAAQLQSWLSEVRGWDGDPRRPAARMLVREVRPGPLMYLARGATEGRDGDGDGDGGKGYILAGEGKVTGLGDRAVVRPGSVVVMEEPVWEVALLGESWTVIPSRHVSVDWMLVPGKGAALTTIHSNPIYHFPIVYDKELIISDVATGTCFS